MWQRQNSKGQVKLHGLVHSGLIGLTIFILIIYQYIRFKFVWWAASTEQAASNKETIHH